MAKVERKYPGSLTLGRLELVLEAHEALFGTLAKLEALGGYTVATYEDTHFPMLSSLALLTAIGGAAPPTPAGTTLLLSGAATILGQKMAIAAYRTA